MVIFGQMETQPLKKKAYELDLENTSFPQNLRFRDCFP